MEFLHRGNPKITKEAVWKETTGKDRLPSPSSKDLTPVLLNMLSHYNVCSKEGIVRQYDHEVQGGSVVKPFVGPQCDGPSDAAVVAPKMNSAKGIVISNGINVLHGKIDPFWMAAGCIDEAMRQIVCVGGDPDRVALLDNFCWGNPDKPDRLGSLVRCAQGCYEAAVAYRAPFISGKDSLYNEYAQGKESIAIPGTILISAIGMLDEVGKAVTMDLKAPGNLIYIVGLTKPEMGGSIYYDTLGLLGNSVPRVDFAMARKIFLALHQAVQQKLVRSMHDCAEGGLGVALAEMAFSGGLGLKVKLASVPFEGTKKSNDAILFSESHSRFVVEVRPASQGKFESLLGGIPYACIGEVNDSSRIAIQGIANKPCVKTTVNAAKAAWKAPLNW